LYTDFLVGKEQMKYKLTPSRKHLNFPEVIYLQNEKRLKKSQWKKKSEGLVGEIIL